MDKYKIESYHIAIALQQELGLWGGIRYAERKAKTCTNIPMSQAYKDAARWLKNRNFFGRVKP